MDLELLRYKNAAKYTALAAEMDIEYINVDILTRENLGSLTLNTSKNTSTVFLTKVGVFLSISFLAVFLAIFLYPPLSKLHLCNCHKHTHEIQ